MREGVGVGEGATPETTLFPGRLGWAPRRGGGALSAHSLWTWNETARIHGMALLTAGDRGGRTAGAGRRAKVVFGQEDVCCGEDTIPRMRLDGRESTASETGECGLRGPTGRVPPEFAAKRAPPQPGRCTNPGWNGPCSDASSFPHVRKAEIRRSDVSGRCS